MGVSIENLKTRVQALAATELVAFFVFSITILVWVGVNNVDEIGHTGLMLVSSHVIVVCGLQVVVLAVSRRFLLRPESGRVGDWLYRIVFAALLVFNVYTILLVHLPSESAAFVFRPLIAIALFAAVVALFERRLWPTVSVFGMALSAILVAQAVAKTEPEQAKGTDRPVDWGQPTDWKVQDFKSRPNIYLISFDAMVPDEIVDFFLDLPAPAYSNWLRQAGFREVDPAMTPNVPTKASLNSMVAIDLDFYDRHEDNDRYKFVSGIYPSPLYHVLKKNGYTINVSYRSEYFGRKGIHIDNYIINDYKICQNIDTDLAFLWFCRLEQTSVFRSMFPDIYTTGDHYDLIFKTTEDDESRFLLTYITFPHHTKNSYDTYSESDYEEYRVKFTKGQGVAIAAMEQIFEKIKQDPEAIVIVFGDHGMYRSRTWSKRDAGQADPSGLVWTEQLEYIDEHRVAMFVWPADFCRDEIKPPYVLSDLGRSLAICLSGNKDFFPGDFGVGKVDWGKMRLPSRR